jgi:diaminohydroxyphosphoribosylaminopyrimidine deaminase/5-amino-6-(5-phosphoribosylamino)uracil reductase
MPRPRVTLKLATSLDGRIATASGESRWITGEAARAEVQCLRAAHDVVLIGAETARRDNPSLLARTEPAPLRQPARAVLTTRLDLASNARLFTDVAESPVILITAENVAPSLRLHLEAAGARIEQVALLEGGLDLKAALERLYALGYVSVLAEGGGKVAASLIAADAVDRIEWFRAPVVLGAAGRPAIGGLNYASLAQAPKWRRLALRELGPDIWESYERAVKANDH